MFKPGQSGNPAGRPVGSKNKSSETIRQAYVDLINNNLDNITIWLEKVAKEDPAKALDFMMKLSPFVLPKLNQTDLTTDGEPFRVILPPPPKND